ncbi:MAG: SDR family oxidoreductase [Ilumatobacteraceae bacterium]
MLQVMQYVASAMMPADLGGVIVNSASMAGVGGAPSMAYSASKAAVIALTRSAAKDLAPHNIRVSMISAFIGPGRMWDNQVARQAEAGVRPTPTTLTRLPHR